MSDAWYYANKNGQVGPLTLRELKETLATFPSTKVDDVLVWRDGFPEWKPAKDVAELRKPPVPPPLPGQTRLRRGLIFFGAFVLFVYFVGNSNKPAPAPNSRDKIKEYEPSPQLTHPERFVTIELLSWSKEGFGSVMEADFTISNGLPWPVKDIEILCEHDAPSGTTIDSNKRTLYERIGANDFKIITKFNMGFIHSQATRSACRITGVVPIR
jgi:hypothetical protein